MRLLVGAAASKAKFMFISLQEMRVERYRKASQSQILIPQKEQTVRTFIHTKIRTDSRETRRMKEQHNTNQLHDKPIISGKPFNSLDR